MQRRYLLMGICFAVWWSVSASGFAQIRARIKPETLQGFDHYVEQAEAAMEQQRGGKKAFLMLYDHRQDMEHAQNGEIIVTRLSSVGDGSIAGGLVHDWVGSMLIPGASVEAVLHVLQDFNRHKSIYPEVLDSRLIKHEGDSYWFYYRLKKEKILTVVLNTEHEARYVRGGAGRWYCSSRSTRIAEVSDPGTAHEHELPLGYDHGFLWRLDAYWFLEETPKGVFVECRAISLTRDVPRGLGWIINPIISDLPRDSLKSTLEFTRNAVLSAR